MESENDWNVNDHKILKLLLRLKTKVQDYNVLSLINPLDERENMTWTNRDYFQNYVLASGPDYLLRIPISQCKRFNDCNSCVASRDPYCGWCPTYNSCVATVSCPKPVTNYLEEFETANMCYHYQKLNNNNTRRVKKIKRRKRRKWRDSEETLTYLRWRRLRPSCTSWYWNKGQKRIRSVVYDFRKC